ncbi:hypothetical protein PENTCL1PPCAC_24024, partial [Pristionchus entomophagus]
QTKEDMKVTYTIIGLIGSGGFGAVFKAQCQQDGRMVALKCEPLGCRHPMLKLEWSLIRRGRSSGSPYFTAYMDRGARKDRFMFISMQLVRSTVDQ